MDRNSSYLVTKRGKQSLFEGQSELFARGSQNVKKRSISEIKIITVIHRKGN